MPANHLCRRTTISSLACLAQTYFFITFGGADSILLSAMAYDHYVAICHLLRCVTIKSILHWTWLVMVPWISANLISLVHTLLVTRLSFCTNRTPHFFCDLNALIKLSCSDTQVNETLVLVLRGLVVWVPFVYVVASYTPVSVAVWKAPSAQGKRKAFSTCGSHLCAVFLFYQTIIGVYFNPASMHTTQTAMAATVMCTLVAPTPNPFIHSLQSRELRGALGKLLSWNLLS
ncbi:olfactory receptor 24-like [Lemur catta]|uniref:olfactory receptor 24-like n=1 Tax=Lemur catta TaxID=9447 RepID=UPI001E26E03E|nr:olfactory receptor 24-like [Lemur catta]XP_045408678.1 olfactory receptor 24-like [Lemur catta]XP_045408681.1 olfactory receptor 24-like [Lemur catta]XP_045408688.1 olfactory receptor 24-like [Lemur catta]XP_045408694.1 olfactory receptor 24-like [Lemur catta]XP_045408698.1 olfactory receptor 24-like [Lemur catta]XP_045408699.1 olfactory receptor 24-like [Lemur catta]XP_045408700.1 olfactory receptor 24-like [Lemur catta]XP_045408701.1 olfactory receptor 24-like [Lemur catta]XP_04540870